MVQLLIPIIEGSADALAWLRFALASIDTASAVNTLTESMVPRSFDEFKYHQTVNGEQVYFLIFSHRLIKDLAQHASFELASDAEVMEAATAVLSSSRMLNASPNAVSKITDFVYHLGYQLGKKIPDFDTRVRALINSETRSYQIYDPFFAEMATTGGDVTGAVKHLIGIFMPDKKWWDTVCKIYKAGTVVSYATRVVDSTNRNRIPIFKQSTLLSVLADGAAAANPRLDIEIPVMNGPHALALYSPMLTAAFAPAKQTAVPVGNLGLTPQIIAATAISKSSDLGYVPTEDGWIHVTDATTEVIDNPKGGKITKIVAKELAATAFDRFYRGKKKLAPEDEALHYVRTLQKED